MPGLASFPARPRDFAKPAGRSREDKVSARGEPRAV